MASAVLSTGSQFGKVWDFNAREVKEEKYIAGK